MTLTLLVLAGIEMASWRLDAEMSCGAFCNARNRSSELLGCSWLRLKCVVHRRRSQRWPFLSLSQTNVLRDSGSHHRERRQQHPKPPALANSSREHYGDDQKRDAQKDVIERLIEGRLSSSPAPSTPSALLDLFNWGLSNLPRQCLRYQTDIRPAPATKACTIDIVCGAFRTEHLYFSPLTFSVRWRLAS